MGVCAEADDAVKREQERCKLQLVSHRIVPLYRAALIQILSWVSEKLLAKTGFLPDAQPLAPLRAIAVRSILDRYNCISEVSS